METTIRKAIKELREQFKVGDWIEMMEDCGPGAVTKDYVPKGCILQLIEFHGTLYADYNMPDLGCSCKSKWRLVNREERVFDKDIEDTIRKAIKELRE